MRVNSIQNSGINYSYYNQCVNSSFTRSSSLSPSFYGYCYKPKNNMMSYVNPIKYYLDNILTNSLIASRRRIIPLVKTLEPYTQEVSVGKSYGWDINKNNRKKYIMIFHGLGQNISNLQGLYEDVLNKTDYAIFAPEYRGFGKNPPTILSQKTFQEDSNNAYNYLINEKNIKPKDIIVLGHSFGSFVATQFVEKKQNIQQMILVSPLDSLTTDSIKMNKGLKRRLPPFIIFLFDHFDFLKKSYVDIFDTNSHLKHIKTPVSIIHSQNDNTIKAVSARKLASMCPNLNQLQILPNGGHKMETNKINAIIELLKELVQ